MKELAEFILDRKPKKVRTLQYLALMGLSRQQVYNWRNNEGGMSLDTYRTIVRYFAGQKDFEAIKFIVGYAADLDGVTIEVNPEL